MIRKHHPLNLWGILFPRYGFGLNPDLYKKHLALSILIGLGAIVFTNSVHPLAVSIIVVQAWLYPYSRALFEGTWAAITGTTVRIQSPNGWLFGKLLTIGFCWGSGPIAWPLWHIVSLLREG